MEVHGLRRRSTSQIGILHGRQQRTAADRQAELVLRIPDVPFSNVGSGDWGMKCDRCSRTGYHLKWCVHWVQKRPANADMVEGFRDGYDLSAPEPSDNRSASYRHGFMCARIDKGRVSSPGSENLHRMADEAMDTDALQQTPGA